MTSESRAAGEPQPSSGPPPAAPPIEPEQPIQPESRIPPEPPALRLSDAEREAVARALAVHGESGRLSAAELEDRQVLAARATTWSAVQPLFADLPEPHPRPGDPPGELSVVPAGHEPAPGGVRRFLPVVPHSSRKPILALTSFAALITFWQTGDWLWFLAIPIVKILITWGEDDD